MKQKLLILNGSLSEATLIEKAKQLGFYVITSGNMPSLMGHALADEYIPADYSDKEAILNIVREHHIDRVVSCANDFGVLTASYVCEKLGIPGHDTYENACILHQKDAFKAFIQDLGIRTPYSTPFDNIDEALSFIKTAEYPIIVKAVDLTGGKGILKAENEDEAVFAVNNAFEASRSKRIVIEPFVIGVQQSIDAFVINKKVVASITNDVFCPINPYLIQSELLPAKGIENYEAELHSMIELICEKLDLVDGMFTMQYIVKDNKPYIIEMMRRALGNQFLTVAHAVTGFPFEEALIRAETGMPLDSLKWEQPLAPYAGHHGIMATRNGTVKGYTVDPEVEKHIFKKIDILKPGEKIENFLNERVAYIYYTFSDYDEAVETVSHLNDLIHIEFED